MTPLLALLHCWPNARIFTAPRSSLVAPRGGTQPTRNTQLAATPDDDEPELFGGYTAKQRMREEIESPFRKVRLIFFGASTGSALLALYFSILNVAKAATGFSNDIPLDEAVSSTAINVVAVLACAAITWNDYQAGERTPERIAQGGRSKTRRVAGDRSHQAENAHGVSERGIGAPSAWGASSTCRRSRGR